MQLQRRPDRAALALDNGPLRGLSLRFFIRSGSYTSTAGHVSLYQRSQSIQRAQRCHSLTRSLQRRPLPDSLTSRGIIWSTAELKVSGALVATMRRLQKAMTLDGVRARFGSFDAVRDKCQMWSVAAAESAWTREYMCAGRVSLGKRFWEAVNLRERPTVPA